MTRWRVFDPDSDDIAIVSAPDEEDAAREGALAFGFTLGDIDNECVDLEEFRVEQETP